MWLRLSLRHRIYTVLTALVIITVSGGLVMVWYTYRMERLFSGIIDRDLVGFQVAAALEASLVHQKGFVSYYYMDGDPEWLRRLGEYRQIFKERLREAETLSDTPRQKEILEVIRSDYDEYIQIKDRVIDYYKTGAREGLADVHPQLRELFFHIVDQCEVYKHIFTDQIRETRAEAREQAERLRYVAGGAILFELFLALFLAFVLVSHILGPVRRLTLAAEGGAGSGRVDNEITALSRSVRGLIQDAGQVHLELERSREHLLQSEKMALVGKLAAGTAHSIRNPLTSVKMRLFSLGRSLVLTETQKEDFEVISQEIRHIDTIVQNFLEFSRPPKLQFQEISPSTVVDMAVQLLSHRLDAYDATVMVRRTDPLPTISGDPEQLKEVLVNLIVNACEAMGRGGAIVIREEIAIFPRIGKAAVIHLSDNGPGMSEAVASKAVQPFFTTKDEGTGLGLSIALRILEEHKGTLNLESAEGEGATFTIALPVKGADT